MVPLMKTDYANQIHTILNDEPDIIKLVKSGTLGRLGNLFRTNEKHSYKKLTFPKEEDTDRMWRLNRRLTGSRNSWNPRMKGKGVVKEPKQKHC